MRVLILADRSFATREHAMLRRLEIGLIDEGIRVLRAQPKGCPAEPTTGLAGIVSYNDRAWRYIMPAPEGAIARDIEALALDARPDSDEDFDSSIDLIHAFGDKAASLALLLAGALGSPTLLEVWSASLCARMAAIEHRHARLDSLGLSVAWLAPDTAILDAAGRSATRWPVLPSRWGVHTPAAEPAQRRENSPISLAVLSSGLDPQGALAFLDGLARAAATHEDLLVFLDSAAVEHSPVVWRRATELGLLDRLSVIADMESRRDLILSADLLVQPESRGEHRTVILEAMAWGVAVLARSDPLVECLHTPQAVTVLERTPEAWERSLLPLLGDRAVIARVGAAGREYARDQCAAHRQVEATLAAYRTMCSPPSRAYSLPTQR